MANKPESEGGGFKLVSSPGPSDPPPPLPDVKPPGAGGTRPPFAKPGMNAPPPPPPKVHVETNDTPVAILGFSGSGKTVYLTMLYYATGVTHAFPNEWGADFLVLDESGKTDSYLKEAYKLILGIGPDGKLIFKDPLGQRVDRRFPKGTDEQEMLQFMLTRSTGVRDFNINVKTLDVKGEALHRFAANIATPKPEDLARDPTLRINYQRWQQMRELCEQAGAILLFFNLLNWEDYDHTADVNTLVGLLLNQKKPPQAFAFVVTGIDVLQDQNEIDRRREAIIQQFQVAIRKLEKKGIAWDVLMISNFGRGFTRKIESLPTNHPCSGKRAGHICNRCQELVPDVNAKPAPVDLEKPWEFVYGAINRRRRQKWIKLGLVAFFIGVLPVSLIGWNLLAGWQHNQQLNERLGALSLENIDEAAALQHELDQNRVYRLFSAAPSADHEQLRFLAEARAVYADTTRPSAERLKAAQEVVPKLTPSFARLVPVEDLQIAHELAEITTGADILHRIEAADRALAQRDRSPSERDKVVKVVENFLAEVLAQLRQRNAELQEVMRSATPKTVDEAAYVDFLRNLQSAIERGELKMIKGATEIRTDLTPMLEDFTTYADYVKVANLPTRTAEQAVAKADALAQFRRVHPRHVLAGASGVLEVDAKNLAKSMAAEELFKKLPPYEPDEITRPGQRNLTRFASVVKTYADFVQQNRGPRVDEVRNRLKDMRTASEGLVTSIEQAADRERTAMKAQEIRRTMVEWETEVARTESDITALQDLAKIFPDLPMGGTRAKLAELLTWKRAALDVARIIASVPTSPSRTQIEDQRKELAAIAQRLKDDVPARQQAQVEAGRLEDTLLANEMDEELARLPPPEKAAIDSPASAFHAAIKGHDDFLKKYSERLNSSDRRARFQRFLADTQRRDPLKTSQDYRERLAAKLAEKELWEKIDAAQTRRNVADRDNLLHDTQAYLDRYPTGEKVSAVRSIRQLVEAWRVEKVSFRIDTFGATPASTALTLTVRPVGSTTPLIRRTFPIANKTIAPTVANPGISFDWNNAQDVELEVVVSGAAGQEIYKHVKRVNANDFKDTMSELFPVRSGITFKLAPQT